VTKYLDQDIYRLSVRVEGAGWDAQLRNALATAKFGETVKIPVYIRKLTADAGIARIILTATSESDPTKSATIELSTF